MIRGKLHNPYDVPVSDVRLIIRLLAAGDQPRELNRVEKDLDVTIEPGGEVTFDRQMDTSKPDKEKLLDAAFCSGPTSVPLFLRLSAGQLNLLWPILFRAIIYLPQCAPAASLRGECDSSGLCQSG